MYIDKNELIECTTMFFKKLTHDEVGQRTSGSSFHANTIFASVRELKKIFGETTYEVDSFDGKVTHEWVFETTEGYVFTLYDWKMYRELSDWEQIEWHIGAHNPYRAMVGEHLLEKTLRQERKVRS